MSHIEDKKVVNAVENGVDVDGKEAKDSSPTVALLSKKLRAIKKKLTKLQETEKKASTQNTRLHAEQLQALKDKDHLERLSKELEEILKSVQQIEKATVEEEAAKSKQEAAQHEKAFADLKLKHEQEKSAIVEGLRADEVSAVVKLVSLNDLLHVEYVNFEDFFVNAANILGEEKIASKDQFNEILTTITNLRANFHLGNLPLDSSVSHLKKYIEKSSEEFVSNYSYAQIGAYVSDLTDVFSQMYLRPITVEPVTEVDGGQEAQAAKDQQPLPTFNFLHASHVYDEVPEQATQGESQQIEAQIENAELSAVTQEIEPQVSEPAKLEEVSQVVEQTSIVAEESRGGQEFRQVGHRNERYNNQRPRRGGYGDRSGGRRNQGDFQRPQHEHYAQQPRPYQHNYVDREKQGNYRVEGYRNNRDGSHRGRSSNRGGYQNSYNRSYGDSPVAQE